MSDNRKVVFHQFPEVGTASVKGRPPSPGGIYGIGSNQKDLRIDLVPKLNVMDNGIKSICNRNDHHFEAATHKKSILQDKGVCNL